MEKLLRPETTIIMKSCTDLHKNRLLSLHPVNQGCLSVKIDATNFDKPTSPVLVRCAWLSVFELSLYFLSVVAAFCLQTRVL